MNKYYISFLTITSYQKHINSINSGDMDKYYFHVKLQNITNESSLNSMEQNHIRDDYLER